MDVQIVDVTYEAPFRFEDLERQIDRAVRKYDCERFLASQREQVFRFERRVTELGLDPDTVAVVILDVDDPYGGPIAHELLPDVDWQVFRDRHEVPIARGIVYRDGLADIVEHVAPDEASLLRRRGLVVVAMHQGMSVVRPTYDLPR